MHIDATLDLEGRAIEGTLSVVPPAGASRMGFLLPANLSREANPALGPRVMDASYPFGFEPAETVILDAAIAGVDGDVPLAFELQRVPPAWQTYSLDDTLLIVPTSDATLRDHILIRFRTTLPRRLGDEGISDGILTWRFGWYPLPLTSEDLDLYLSAAETTVSSPLYFPAQSVSATIAFAPGVEIAVGADHVEKLADDAETAEKETLQRVHAWNTSPVRSLAIAAASNYTRYTLASDPTPIEVVHRPGHEAEARLYATYAADILARFEQRFGAYPHERLILVEHPDRSGLSLAADGIVWLSGLFFSHRDVTLPGLLDRMTEYVLAHEIAHQWFGIGATPDLASENWLSEGLAQYFAVSDFEERHGAFTGNLLLPQGAGVIEQFIAAQFGFLNLREHQIELPYLINVGRGFDEPLVRSPAEVAYENATTVRLYSKGYLVARALASAVGEEVFDAGLRTIAERRRFDRITTLDLRDALQEVSGLDLEELFAAWVLGAETADYSVSIVDRERIDDRYVTTVDLTRRGGAPQPVVVRATLRSGEAVDRTWEATTSSERMVLETETAVRRVTIDPDHRLPDSDRLNNNDPVKLVTATRANAYPLDAYLIRADASSANVTISYLERARLTIGEGVASASIQRGRSHRIAVEADVAQGDLSGRLAYTYIRFAQPETGTPGIYWEPDAAYTVSVRRLLDGPRSLTVLGLTAQGLPSLAGGGTLAAEIDTIPWSAARLLVRATDELRLLPNVYLQGTLAVGLGTASLPDVLRFHLQELRSLGRIEGWRWQPSQVATRHKLCARLAVEFPTGGDLPFNVFNLFMIDRARARPYVALGTGWTTLATLGDTTPHVEAGVEASFDVSAIGGLLPFRATLGYAVPIAGGGAPVVFLGLSL